MKKSCFSMFFASYTPRMVFILCQIDQLTFPTDSENMNPIRALFLVENHDFQPKYLSKSTKLMKMMKFLMSSLITDI